RLLEPETQALFRRLAVFAGGITMAAAMAVGWIDEPAAELDVLEGLSALVDLNLLRREETPVCDSLVTEVRFSMLETIREYGREQLTATGETAAVRRRHADYYLTLAEQA